MSRAKFNIFIRIFGKIPLKNKNVYMQRKMHKIKDFVHKMVADDSDGHLTFLQKDFTIKRLCSYFMLY